LRIKLISLVGTKVTDPRQMKFYV